MKIDSPNSIGVSTVNGNLTVTGTTNIGNLTASTTTVNGNLRVTGTTNTGALTATTLNLTTIGSGTSVTNLGITSGGGIVTGSTMVTPTYIQATNGSGQTLIVGNTTLTNWTNEIASNAGEWNPTTGVFTATKAGTYQVYAIIQTNTIAWQLGTEVTIWFTKNGSISKPSRWYATSAFTGYPPSIQISTITTLAVGNTISFVAYHNNNINPTLLSNGNYMTIQEVPSKIVR